MALEVRKGLGAKGALVNDCAGEGGLLRVVGIEGRDLWDDGGSRELVGGEGGRGGPPARGCRASGTEGVLCSGSRSLCEGVRV